MTKSDTAVTDKPIEKQPEPDYIGHRARMRQKLFEKGSTAFSDTELLELILMAAIPRKDVKPIAKRLFRHFVRFSDIIHADIHELKQVEGVGDAVISLLKIVEGACHAMLKPDMEKGTVLKEWHQVIDFCRFHLSYEKVEHLYLVYLDNQMRLITIDDFQKGTTSRIIIVPQEILKRALNLGATSIIMVHNHPSGYPKPSREDIQQTVELSDFLSHAGVSVYDHLIIAKQSVYSLNRKGIVA